MNDLNKKTVLHKLGLLVPMLIFMVVYMAWFSALENMSGIHYHVIHAALDDLIPFCEYFIVPYYMWFLFVPVFILYILMVDEEVYRKTSYILMAGMLIFLVISTFYPTMQDLRPEVMPNNNVFCDMVSSLYASDTPTNVLPSIHVFNTVTGIVAIYACRQNRPNDGVFCTVMTVVGILIVLSTMFLKQHSTWDVLVAAILYGVCYGAVTTSLVSSKKERLATHGDYRI